VGHYYLAPEFITILDRDKAFIHLRAQIISGWVEGGRLGTDDFRPLTGDADLVVSKERFMGVCNKVRELSLERSQIRLLPHSRDVLHSLSIRCTDGASRP